MRIPIRRQGKRAGRIFGMRMSAVLAVGAVISAVVGIGAAAATIGEDSPNELQQQINSAAKEFHVPASVLTALSTVLTRGESTSAPGAFGPMGLHGEVSSPIERALARGTGPGQPPSSQTGTATNARAQQITQAAQLLKVSASRVMTDQEQNVRGAAALLADSAKKLNNNQPPATVPGWYSAVAAFATGDPMTGAPAADRVFSLLKSGSTFTTKAGQKLTVPADPTLSVKAQPQSDDAAECPAELACRFVGAAYQPVKGTNKYGNFDAVNDRAADGVALNSIVLHALPGTMAAAIADGLDPTSGASEHYLIGTTGDVVQQVSTQDIAWQAGNWYVNSHSIGIAMERDAKTGSFTPATYQAVAKLVQFLASKNNIPLDRAHVLAGEEISVDQTAARPAGNVLGAQFDWSRFSQLAGLRTDAKPINPAFPAVKIVTDSKNTPVKLYAEPSTSSRVLASSAGSAVSKDDSAAPAPQLLAGQVFSVAEERAGFTAVFYADKKGWLPTSSTTPASPDQIVTAVGVTRAEVLTSPLPPPEEYPTSLGPNRARVLGNIEATQRYAVLDKVNGQDLLTRFAGLTLLRGNTPLFSNTQYYVIQYGPGIGFVRADAMELAS